MCHRGTNATHHKNLYNYFHLPSHQRHLDLVIRQSSVSQSRLVFSSRSGFAPGSGKRSDVSRASLRDPMRAWSSSPPGTFKPRRVSTGPVEWRPPCPVWRSSVKTARRLPSGASKEPRGDRQVTALPGISPPMVHPLVASPKPCLRPPAFTPVIT